MERKVYVRIEVSDEGQKVVGEVNQNQKRVESLVKTGQ